MKVYNLGSLNIDYVYAVEHFVAAGETLSSENMNVFPGGKGLNQSIALAHAGVKVVHGAKIGDGGEFLLETLKAANVDISRIEKINGSCGHAIIQVDKSGQNCILLYAGTNHCIDSEYINKYLAEAEKDDVLLLQNEVNGLDMVMEAAHQKGMRIAFNPSPIGENIKNLPLEYVTWWFCNEVEGEALFGSKAPEQICESFLKKYPESNLILTLGKRGSMFVNKDCLCEQVIYPTEVVDTTAAGDTFTGYFLSGLFGGMSGAESLELATKASAIAVSRMGAATSIPLRDEVLNLR